MKFLTDPDARAVAEETPFAFEPGAAHPTREAAVEAREGVVFARSGKTAEWSGAAKSLLDLAEQSGLSPDFSCRTGICNSCKCTLLEGEVEYFEDPLDPPGAGEVLICCSRPKGPVVLDL